MSPQAGIPPYGTKGLSRRCFPTGDENPRPGFKESYHMTLIDILRWTASISGMIAAILVSLNAGARITGIGFIIFSGSSVVWIAASLMDGNNPLAVQNLVLFGINIFGIYRYLLRKPGSGNSASDAG